MKARLNLTIDSELLDASKAYAAAKQISLSELVEGFFKTLARPKKRKNVLDLLDKLGKPVLDMNLDLKEEYYKGRSGKYGF